MFSRNATAALLLLWLLPGARATIVGLNQIVTPDIQPEGLLGLSVQAQHAAIGNSRQLQAELGLTPRLEAAWFQGMTPGEGLFSAEFNLVQQGPHLLSAGAVNWSTLGHPPQPELEYGYYTDRDHFIAGGIVVGRHAEALLGYRRQFSERWQFSADFQAGAANSTTVGLTYNFTDSLSVNPALYRTNGHPHHLYGYVVLTWNLALWKPRRPSP